MGQPPFGIMGQPPVGIMGQPPVGIMGQPPVGIQGRPPFGNQGQPPVGIMGQPPGGIMGRPPGGIGGQGNQFGQIQGGFGGQAGNQGRPPFGNQGQPPFGIMGQPGMGVMGRANMGNMGGVPNRTPAAPLNDSDYVLAVIEVKKFHRDVTSNITKIKIPVVIDHRWGKTALYEDKNEIQFVGKKISTPEQLFVAEKEKLEKAKVHGVDEYLNLARWCLEYGLVGRCKEMIGVAETKLAEAKDQNVSALGTASLEAYAKIKPILNNDISGDKKARVWKDRLGYAHIKSTKHYALIHSAVDETAEGVTRRLDQLERNFEAFYLWFALRGKALPAPTERMVSILISDANDFKKNRLAFDAHDLVSDGFYARQDNLAIFSANRVDKASRDFSMMVDSVYKNINVQEEDLLHAKYPANTNKPGGPTTANVSRCRCWRWSTMPCGRKPRSLQPLTKEPCN